MTAHYLAHVPPEAEEEHKQHRYDKQNNSLSKNLHHHRHVPWERLRSIEAA